MQAVRRGLQGYDLLFAAAFITAQQSVIAAINVIRFCRQQIGQRARILKAEIDTVARQRVNGVRCVANQRKTRRD